MKKGILTVTAVLFLTFSGLAMAQMDKGKDMMGDKMMGKSMMGMMGDKKMGMCPMMGGMMSSMMGKSMVATSDGGIVDLVGNKITKYDKDLNVIKEAEVKMDMEGMQKNIMDMMKSCPMMKGMGGMDKSGDKTESTDTPAAGQVDHASHH